MKEIPSFESYGDYAKPNVRTLKFWVGDLVIWFSYKTPVAFRQWSKERVVRENDWSVTTGKHLNWIDGGDYKNRVPGEKFERLLKEALSAA